jgi:hypothetical protein
MHGGAVRFGKGLDERGVGLELVLPAAVATESGSSRPCGETSSIEEGDARVISEASGHIDDGHVEPSGRA